MAIARRKKQSLENHLQNGSHHPPEENSDSDTTAGNRLQRLQQQLNGREKYIFGESLG
jgi:hypothetical protein